MAFEESNKEKINDLIFKDYNFNLNHQNLLIYGLDEYHEGYFINKLLANIYQDEIITEKLEHEIPNYNKTKINIKRSDYHVEFNPNNSGSDRYALLSLISEYGKNQMVNMIVSGAKNNRRTIIINKIDNLNYYCQASLRRNMEKYSNISNFILISSNLSKVSEPIKSRCSLITIKSLDEKLKSQVLKSVFPKIKVNKKKSICNNLLTFELNRLNLGKIIDLSDYINNLMLLVKEPFSNKQVRKIKNILYNLYISNFTLDSIILEINNYIILSKLDNKLKYLIFQEIIKTNITLNQGKRNLIHLENLVFKIYNLLIKNNIN